MKMKLHEQFFGLILLEKALLLPSRVPALRSESTTALPISSRRVRSNSLKDRGSYFLADDCGGHLGPLLSRFRLVRLAASVSRFAVVPDVAVEPLWLKFTSRP